MTERLSQKISELELAFDLYDKLIGEILATLQLEFNQHQQITNLTEEMIWRWKVKRAHIKLGIDSQPINQEEGK